MKNQIARAKLMKISRLAKYCILQGLQNIFSLQPKTKDITLQSQQNKDTQ